MRISTTRIVTWIRTSLLAALVPSCCASSDHEKRLDDASGILVHERSLWFVGNETASSSTLFEWNLGGEGIKKLIEREWTLVPQKLHNSGLRTKKAYQLEDLGLLGDRVVALSETTRDVYGIDGKVLDYGSYRKLEEQGGRGLEGLALRESPEGTTQVAVLWEGGRPKGHSEPKSPRVLVHEIPNALVKAPGFFVLDRDRVAPLRLDHTTMVKHLGVSDAVRAPALEWIELNAGTPEREWGVLVLLSSMDSNSRKWLQRFSLKSGEPHGPPLPLDKAVSAKHQRKVDWNWEGLAWLDTSRCHVVLVNDDGSKAESEPTSVLVVSLEGWPES